MSWFLTGVGVGMILMLWMISASLHGGSVDTCRAAHPGFDCRLGWVVGEAFK